MSIVEPIGFITDEMGPDIAEALAFALRQDVPYVELRTVWGKNLIDLTDDEQKRLISLIGNSGRLVSALASPLFKCPVPAGSARPGPDTFLAPELSADEHLARLPRLARLALGLGTPYLRCFAFWQEENPLLVWETIISYLIQAAHQAERLGIVLVLENEATTNAATGAEAAALCRAVGSPALRLCWDPGNTLWAGGVPFPDDLEAVHGLVARVHIKDVVRNPTTGEAHGILLGQGDVDYRSIVPGLRHAGYGGPFVLEPHWPGPGPSANMAVCIAALRTLLADQSHLDAHL